MAKKKENKKIEAIDEITAFEAEIEKEEAPIEVEEEISEKKERKPKKIEEKKNNKTATIIGVSKDFYFVKMEDGSGSRVANDGSHKFGDTIEI